MEQKRANVLEGNNCWFRKGGYTSTITVPPTPGGKLMQQVEQNLKNGRQPKGTKIKVIEGNGVSSQLGLTRSNQFPRNKCTRENCVMCVEESEMGKRMKCESSNIGYEGDCSRCTDNVYKYAEETSRTVFIRIRQYSCLCSRHSTPAE